MKKFLIRAILFSLLIIVSLVAIVVLVSPLVRGKNDYVAATIDKESRLHSLPSPKIIFVGGSNLAFGINSSAISKEFNYPVVNMSLHGGLGLSFMLNEALDGVKKSDIVLLSTEYYLDKPELKLLTQLMDANPNAKKYITLKPEELIPFYISDLQRCVTSSVKVIGKQFSDNIYIRNGFTVEGDLVSHLNKKNVPLVSPRLKEIDYTDDLQLINTFIDAVKKKGATVYYLFPTYQQSTFTLNKKVVTDFATLFHKNLKCPIINTPDTFVYNDSLYFNSEYHLNKQGREIRTQKLIEILGKTF
ncbi:hypothetical protein SAMN05428975_5232 [Mucilaginibacter sp. OK268]|uniref:hypothetical protein n=1 Tax=Mucilaginibacter sp. OK268 TaxID=1881048 RepID=UPI000885E8F2|nr:hypothetical protein [Mucilaginibacter sp. OK268]SDQ00083.1 hypothetical protein SAMN05428975_5232 [Mucilaginibacter sp. OK268]